MMRTVGQIQQLRVVIAVANAWNAIAIPAGAQDTCLGLELSTATMRVSNSNALNATTEGQPVLPAGVFLIEGEFSAGATIYVASSAPTVAILIYSLPT